VTLAPDVGSAAAFLHSPGTVSSPVGAVGLWRTTLTPAAPDGPLAVTPVSVDHGDDPFPLPLTQADRLSIEHGGSPLTASCQRLELSALGGSLTAHARSDSFDWEQQIAVGRDVHVRTATVVRLYPFNHRAVFIETTDRVFDALGPDQAALKKDSRLIILERVVDVPVSDRLGRQFPFHRVEILDSVLPQVISPSSKAPGRPGMWRQHERPSLILESLRADRRNLQDSRDANLVAIGPALASPRTEQELRDAGFPQLFELDGINQQFNSINDQLGPAEEAVAASDAAQDQADQLQRQIDDLENHPVGPDGQLDPGTQQQIAELGQQINDLRPIILAGDRQLVANLKAQMADLERQAQPLQQAVDAELARPHTVDELAAAGVFEAQEVLRLDEAIAVLDGRINDQLAGAAVKVNWFFVPSDRSQQPVRFSLRVSGSVGDLTLTMPLIAVNDFSLPAAEGFAEFTSLTDPDTADAVGKVWAEISAGAVTMPPTPVGLVRAAQPRLGDVQEVRGLTIEGAMAGVGFRPKLSSFQVGLPELRTLLGQLDEPTLAFTDDFLDNGDVEDLAFQMLDGATLDLNFIEAADKSGGLVSPRIIADGISRQFGPVVSDGVRELAAGRVDARKLLADGATLLGFDLRDLVKSIDEPPAIVSDLVSGGVPVVRMQWRSVPLHSSGPFVANPGAVLDLDVESSPSRTITTCTVTNIALSLPTPDTELLRLTFGRMVFTQEPGKAPKLDVDGLDMEFLGELRLLQVLQEAVDLGDKGPKVDASPTGVVATYSLPVPEVSTGSFVMRNIVFRAGVEVPFTGDPVIVTLGFASREQPFNLSVLALGGGGYVELEIDHSGLRAIEAALEFGATVAVDFLVVVAEVHAIGGIRYTQLPDKTVDLAGYIRIGGSVELLGLVSVSVELLVALHYEQASNEMVGRATLVVDIDLTLYSHKVELDSGRWAISGGALPFASPASLGPRLEPDGVVRPAAENDRAAWEQYRKAFAA
jgi:hypothetical protein